MWFLLVKAQLGWKSHSQKFWTWWIQVISRSISFAFMAIPSQGVQNKVALLWTEEKYRRSTSLNYNRLSEHPVVSCSVPVLAPKKLNHSAPLSAAVTCCTTLLSARYYSLTQLLIFVVILAVLVLQVTWLFPPMASRAHPFCRCVKRQAYYEAAANSPLCPE